MITKEDAVELIDLCHELVGRALAEKDAQKSDDAEVRRAALLELGIARDRFIGKVESLVAK